MILKVQRPLDDPHGDWLIYAKGHRDLHLMAARLVPEILQRALADYPKAYFEGSIDCDGILRIEHQVEDQDW